MPAYYGFLPLGAISMKNGSTSGIALCVAVGAGAVTAPSAMATMTPALPTRATNDSTWAILDMPVGKQALKTLTSRTLQLQNGPLKERNCDGHPPSGDEALISRLLENPGPPAATYP